MDFEKDRRNTAFSWLFLGMLALLFAVLGWLQYRWIGEVGQAERERLRSGLATSLRRISDNLDDELTSACAALLPAITTEDEQVVLATYSTHYMRWRESSPHGRLFRRIAVAVTRGEEPELRLLDLETGEFRAGEWPESWDGLKQRIAARALGPGFRDRRFFSPPAPEERLLLELPRFLPPAPPGGNQPRRRPMEPDRLILEADIEYLRAEVIPELLRRHLGIEGAASYQAEVVWRSSPQEVIYQTDGGSLIGERADGSVSLFEIQYDRLLRRIPPPEGFRGPTEAGPGREVRPPSRGRWQLNVRHRAGSLDAVVEQARRRNLAVSAGIFLLMLAAVGALVRFTHRSQRLARLQMEFVAGVSHELRTPLSVIRTAAHNLCGGVVGDAARVQKYGALIGAESDRLIGIVEQVLRFAGSKAGRTITAREPVRIEDIIDEALEATAGAIEGAGCTVERRIEADLPLVLADPAALGHTLQNLISNAAKHGAEGGWIGITAWTAGKGDRPAVEIRVADRGRGIPKEELGQIFDPFYRGKRAMEGQIRGTGLGLNLVKRIIEAHGGEVQVESEPGKGTEFVLRIPAAPAEMQNEFTNSAG
jgi:signal transduction histidine kinase